ncbi:hypothetical protein K2Y11_14115 [bacterium]|nr:hypothetical protein [bacterium]
MPRILYITTAVVSVLLGTSASVLAEPQPVTWTMKNGKSFHATALDANESQGLFRNDKGEESWIDRDDLTPGSQRLLEILAEKNKWPRTLKKTAKGPKSRTTSNGSGKGATSLIGPPIWEIHWGDSFSEVLKVLLEDKSLTKLTLQVNGSHGDQVLDPDYSTAMKQAEVFLRKVFGENKKDVKWFSDGRIVGNGSIGFNNEFRIVAEPIQVNGLQCVAIINFSWHPGILSSDPKRFELVKGSYSPIMLDWVRLRLTKEGEGLRNPSWDKSMLAKLTGQYPKAQLTGRTDQLAGTVLTDKDGNLVKLGWIDGDAIEFRPASKIYDDADALQKELNQKSSNKIIEENKKKSKDRF